MATWLPWLFFALASSLAYAEDVRIGSVADDQVALLQSQHVDVRAVPRHRVLIFIAVGDSEKTIDRVMRNAANLHKHNSTVESHIFLAHYKKQEKWLDVVGTWYEHSVHYAATSSGYKMQMAKKLLPAHLAENSYDFVWVLDEDVDFSSSNITLLFDTAARSGALVSQPAIGGMYSQSLMLQTSATVGSETGCQPDDGMCHFLAQHACLYRYTNLVEVMAPIMKPSALLLVFNECEYCMHEKAVWGLDKVWCSWLARTSRVPKDRTCAVIDAVAMRHVNQKTLGKWDGRGERRMDIIHTDYWGALLDTQARYPVDFVEGWGESLKCVQP